MKLIYKAIQICGTGSGVGKSLINCALCRIFVRDGYSVAPFKAQNMALNSFVTEDSGEIGRAQATQALACNIKPTVHMNPILIKPNSNTSAQVILQGKPVRNMSVYEYKKYKKVAFDKVKESFEILKKDYQIIVIEGAGSPAEINLKSHDIVNMAMARFAKAPVILVGDIDKGGVFAWLVGTLQLLTEEERAMVKGFIINKFRGDKRLLSSGIKFLENYTGKKVLGVIPYFKDIKIPEEDSLPEKLETVSLKSKKKIRIGIIYLPHISNFNDFDALIQEPDVSLRYIKRFENLNNLDVIILPGTKNAIEDLGYLKRSNFGKKIVSLFLPQREAVLVGICGGYQMLGEAILDRENIESKKDKVKGLGILPIVTEICREKTLSQVKAKDLSSGIEVSGYEIHHGKTEIVRDGKLCRDILRVKPVFEITRFRNKRARKTDGLITEDQKCWGTYIHGIFDNDIFRRQFLNNLRKRKGWQPLSVNTNYDVSREIDKLSLLVRKNINMDLIYSILFGYGDGKREMKIVRHKDTKARRK